MYIEKEKKIQGEETNPNPKENQTKRQAKAS